MYGPGNVGRFQDTMDFDRSRYSKYTLQQVTNERTEVELQNSAFNKVPW